MPRFSSRSITALMSADKRLQDIMTEVIRFYDCAVIQGHRGEKEQNDYYFRGLSRLRWPQSKHNQSPALAIDVVPWPIDWHKERPFYYMAGIIEATAVRLGHKIRWGGDWGRDHNFYNQDFMDLGHFELI